MTVRIWSSFSCNNSSAFRLIARFSTDDAALMAGVQLLSYVEQHAREHANPRGENSAMQALANHYGLDWEDDGWGRAGDGPHVHVEGDCVLVHHDYCLGLGPGVPAYLVERGATTVDPERSSASLHVSLLFRATSGRDPRFDEELATLTEQLGNRKPGRIKLDAPFELQSFGRSAHFRDGGTVGLFFPVLPAHFATIRAWLTKHGIDDVIMQLDRDADETLFRALADARCTACGGPIDYLDPRLHDIEAPQLVCRPCGGLYDLSTFWSKS